MTTDMPLARYSAVNGALTSGFVIAELHHLTGRDPIHFLAEKTIAMAMHRAIPGEIYDLAPLGPNLKAARTTAIVKSEMFETVRLIVHAGVEIKTHKVEGPITLHCLEGRALIGLPDKTLELSGDQWLHLEGGVPHWVKGIEDTSLLLTILFPTRLR